MGALGATQIMTNPAILQALSPVHAVSFMIDHHSLTFIVLGSVVLGRHRAEALYADMGHFGRRPIRTAWIGLVLPALTLNYLGQGAFVIANLDRLNQEYRTVADAARAVGATTVQFDFSPFFEMAGHVPFAARHSRDCRDSHRQPKLSFRRVLAHATSDPARLAAARRLPHLGNAGRPDLHTADHWLLLAGVLVLTLAFGSSTAWRRRYGISSPARC